MMNKGTPRWVFWIVVLAAIITFWGLMVSAEQVSPEKLEDKVLRLEKELTEVKSHLHYVEQKLDKWIGIDTLNVIR